METTRYAVADRPGYFGNVARVYSSHATLRAARRAMGRGYLDERGERRHPTCVVRSDVRKRGRLYGDAFPEVVA